MDFSGVAIELARRLADEAGLADRARFVRSNVYDLGDGSPIDGEEFDIVYTSFGALFWLPDLDPWADIVARFVRSGERFYLIDHHPFANTFGGGSSAENVRVAHPYFHGRICYDATETGNYAGIDPDELEHGPTHGWRQPIGDIVSSLCKAGFRIEFLHEHPWSTYEAVDAMEEHRAGRYVLPELGSDLPFLFSLLATR